MSEYLLLGYDGDDVNICLAAGTKEECEAEFMNQISDGDFGSRLLLVKVVQSAELRYDIRNWEDGSTEEKGEVPAGSTDTLTEYSRLCAAQGASC
jgi:hypothetical protein